MFSGTVTAIEIVSHCTQAVMARIDSVGAQHASTQSARAEVDFHGALERAERRLVFVLGDLFQESPDVRFRIRPHPTRELSMSVSRSTMRSWNFGNTVA